MKPDIKYLSLPIGRIVCHCLKVERIKVFELSKRLLVSVKYSARIYIELCEVLNLFISSVIFEKKQSALDGAVSYQEDDFAKIFLVRGLHKKMLLSDEGLHSRKYRDFFVHGFPECQLFNLHIKLTLFY